MSSVVTTARQAAQTAEDARIIAIERKRQDDLKQAQTQLQSAQAQAAQAQAAAQTAQTEAAASRALLEQERAARQQVDAEAAPPPPPSAPEPVVQTQPMQRPENQQKTELRIRLYRELSSALPSRDTPRGLVVTLADSDFREANLNPAVFERLARVAAIVAAHPGLTIEVDGNEHYSSERAHAVRDVLCRDGVPPGSVVARALGDSRPLASNATASGREQNRRVEIVIYGNPIGNMPYWAKTYSLAPTQ
jgi:flagellar motor protein MotB